MSSGAGIGLLDTATNRVQRTHSGVAQPREDELRGDPGCHHLVVDHVGSEPAEGQIPFALPDHLVARRQSRSGG